MRVCLATGFLCVCSSLLFAQDKPAADVPFLMQGLQHRGQAIRKRAADELEKAGAAAAASLANQVRFGDLKQAGTAGVVLGRLKGDGVAAVPELLTVLRDPATEEWRWSICVQALGRVAPASRKEALGAAIDALRSGQPLKQHGALALLNALGTDGREAIPALWEAFRAKRQPLRGVVLDESILEDNAVAYSETIPSWDTLAVLETLRKVGADAGQLSGPLKELAAHRDEGVRLLAAGQLSRLDAESRQAAAAAYVSLMSDRRPTVREAAVVGAGALGEAGSAAVPALCGLLKSGEADLRELAATALGEIGPAARSQGLPALEQAVRAESLVASDNSPLSAGARARVEKMTAAVSRIKGED